MELNVEGLNWKKKNMSLKKEEKKKQSNFR